AELCGEIAEIGCDDVERGVRREVDVRARGELVRAKDERRPQSARYRGLQVSLVGGDQHQLARGDIEEASGQQVAFGVWLEVAEKLGTEHAIPLQAAVTGEVDKQREVRVGERGDDEPLVKARQPGGGVGPGVEAMPGLHQ